MIQQCHVKNIIIILRDMFTLPKPIIILISIMNSRWAFCHD